LKRMMSHARLPSELHEAETYYTIDYDFKGASGQKPHPQYFDFYKKFEEMFGERLAKFRSTASVLIMQTYEDALKVAALIRGCGGTAHVRKCERIE